MEVPRGYYHLHDFTVVSAAVGVPVATPLRSWGMIVLPQTLLN